MSTTEKAPSADLKEVLIPTDRIVIEKEGEALSKPESPEQTNYAEPPSAKEQPKITTWSRRGAAMGPTSSLRTPVLRPQSGVEPVHHPKPADPPKAPAQVSTPLQAAAAIQGAKLWPAAQAFAQALTRAPVRMLALFHERPIRRKLKISMIAAAICGVGGVGLALERIVTERWLSHAPKSSADKMERASASMKTQAARNPEPKDPSLVSVSIQSPEEANPAPTPTPAENAPEPKDASDLDVKASRPKDTGDGAQDGVQNNAHDNAGKTLHNLHSSAPASNAVVSPPVAEPLPQRTKPASAKTLYAEEVGFKAALAHGKATNDKRLIASASGELGAILCKRGKLNEAEQMHNRAVAIDVELDRNAELANDYNNLGRVYLAWKKLDLAEESYLKALSIQKKLNANKEIAASYSNLGEVYFDHRDWRKAEDMFKKAIAIENTEGLKPAIALDYDNLGIVYAKRRDFTNACASWRKARRMFQETGMRPELARVQHSLDGRACSRRGWWSTLFHKLKAGR